MTVTAPTATPPTTTTDKTALGKASLADNFNTFLSLLTTQLKNQDPMSPLDSNQFTQQLVQMTGVEQQLNTNDLLKQVVSNTSGGISTAVSLIGKAFAHGAGGILTNTSSGAGKYTAPANTLNLTVNGSDDAGNASDPNPAATIVSQNPKLSICDQPSSWPAFPNVK